MSGAPKPPADSLFAGQYGEERGQRFEATLEMLLTLAGRFPENDPRRRDLEEAVKGLRRMREKHRVRVKPRGELGEGIPAITEVPVVERPSGGGEGTPEGEKQPRDPTEDSTIYFNDEAWPSEGGGGGPGPKPYLGGQFGDDSLQTWFLALALWHEWQHARDGGFGENAICEDLKRHICIVKATQKIAAEWDTTNAEDDMDMAPRWNRNSTPQLTGLMAKCQQEACVDCGECPQGGAWTAQ